MKAQNMPAKDVEVQIRKPVMNHKATSGHESMKH
jgi:hypothetical protein